jgi:hypothetical protein
MHYLLDAQVSDMNDAEKDQYFALFVEAGA